MLLENIWARRGQLSIRLDTRQHNGERYEREPNTTVRDSERDGCRCGAVAERGVEQAKAAFQQLLISP